jgi:hypothetical protein
MSAPARPREALLAFATALEAVSTALRRDECGAPRMNGRRGHIYAVPGGFQLYCVCESRKAWTYAKRALVFATVTQDGDGEGILMLGRLPTPDEAEAIRSYLGITKRPDLSDAEHERRHRLGANLAKNRHRAERAGECPTKAVAGENP